MKKVKELLGEELFWKLKFMKERVLQVIIRIVNVVFRVNIYPVNDYYSPLISSTRLKKNRKRWDAPSSMAGIKYDVPKMEAFLKELLDKHLADYQKLPDFKSALKLGFGPGYTYVDSITSFALLRHLNPATYCEVGSGLSTYYAHEALKDNKQTKIVCVEPYPYDLLKTIQGIQIIQKEVQDVPVAHFESLNEGDVLFLDSSHVFGVDSDITFLYLEVLPRLKKGVYIHIHDIPFPFNTPYPAEFWIFKRGFPRLWNEAMALQAFLCFNDSFEILLSTPLIRHHNEALLEKVIPNYKGVNAEPNTFSSIWLKKVK